MRYAHTPIFQKTYLLSTEIYKITAKFPKEYRFCLGEKLQKVSNEILDLIVYINTQKNKLEPMDELKYKIETLRIHLRLAYDLKILGQKNLESTNKKIEEVCVQIAGWRKWALNNKQA
jgi:hypothetical protein